ncbi:DUF6884 domain-containing protein [Candidatus Borrarchaeum sp.]|uniref:DUF6884 domain-containing protein n=1 Tax=Candidatus Borrarchaeum sp. TaxID=2846742 RepID=UPI00257F9AEB|nr:DUF6884 domain-containing protein [Candidatus Borrarchaeum sp.]
MELSGRHLLIISCSKTKNSQLRNNEEITLPAIQGYDGKIFLTLRKAFREGLGQNVDVLIISAKYGLLRATDEISYYEERMTRQKAHELRDRVLSKLKLIVANGGNYRTIFVMMGKDYFEAISGLSTLIDIPIDIIEMEKIGKAQQKLRNLLLRLNSQIVVS